MDGMWEREGQWGKTKRQEGEGDKETEQGRKEDRKDGKKRSAEVDRIGHGWQTRTNGQNKIGQENGDGERVTGHLDRRKIRKE